MSVSGSLAAGPAWRNHSFIPGGGKDPPLSDQGETIIGVYLLLLGGCAHTNSVCSVGGPGPVLLLVPVLPQSPHLNTKLTFSLAT